MVGNKYDVFSASLTFSQNTVWKWSQDCSCLFLSTGQLDPELPASTAIEQSGSDANHLHLSPLLPFLCGSCVDSCIQRMEVRQRQLKQLRKNSSMTIPHAPDLILIWLSRFLVWPLHNTVGLSKDSTTPSVWLKSGSVIWRKFLALTVLCGST